MKNTIDDVKITYVGNENNLNHGNISNEEIQFNINDQLFLESLMMKRGNTIRYSSEKKKNIKRGKNTSRRHKSP